MDTAKKIILFAVGIILVVGFIAIGMSIFNKGRSSVNNTTSQFDSLTSQYDDVEYANLDGGTASGSEVVRLIQGLEKKDDGVTITVKTKADASSNGTTYSKTQKYEVTDKQNAGYINPSASFNAKVTKNTNGLVSNVTFTQK